MVRRKHRRKFTAPEIEELKDVLSIHRTTLATRIGRLAENPDWDNAIELRDAAQQLVKTAAILDRCGCDQSILETAICLAKYTGEPQTIPYLDECGLEAEQILT